MVIVQARSRSPIFLNITEGSLFPTRTSTSGKILLANSNDSVRDMLLEHDAEFSAFNAQQRKDVLSELVEIKSSGILQQNNALIDGVTDVSVLVGEPEGQVIASLTVSSFNNHLGEQLDYDSLLTQLTDTAKIITEQLGC